MSERPGASESRGARAVERTVDLLECIAADGPELSLADLARATGLPKSTAHRIAETLVRRGLVEREERSQRYRVGPLAAVLGQRALAGLGLDELVPQLYGVAARLGLTVTLALGPPDSLVTVIVAQPPAHNGAGRRAVDDARAADRLRTTALRHAAAMPAHGPGHAHERAADAVAVAVGVPDGLRGSSGALSAHGNVARFGDGRVVQVVPVLHQVASAVGRASSGRAAAR